jgi:hypothetical protein
VIYHIGDGSFSSGSNCYSEVVSTGLSGTKYVFSFSVTSDNVKISASIDHLCGIDLVNNVVQVSKDGVVIPSTRKYIVNHATSHAIASFTGDKGSYKVEIISSNNAAGTSNVLQGNYDDFNVGKVHITGDKPAIKPGTVESQ